jgi:hypothetical protein
MTAQIVRADPLLAKTLSHHRILEHFGGGVGVVASQAAEKDGSCGLWGYNSDRKPALSLLPPLKERSLHFFRRLFSRAARERRINKAFEGFCR